MKNSDFMEPPPSYPGITINDPVLSYPGINGQMGPMETLSSPTPHTVITISTLIAQGGRASMFTMCPHCSNQVHTVVQQAPNDRVLATGGQQLKSFLGGGIFFILFAVGAVSVFIAVSGMWYPIIAVGIICGFVGWGMYWGYSSGKRKLTTDYNDLTHSCPTCHKTLGVSDGHAAYERDRMISALENRRGTTSYQSSI